MRFPIDVASLVRLFVAGLALACGLLGEASAQELTPAQPKQRGAFFVPTLTVSETLDDNLLFTQLPESDFVTRVDFGVQTGFRSTPFTIDGQASRAGDAFRRHRDFDTTRARTMGQLSLSYVPSRRLTLAVAAFYLETQTPSELNLLSGLAVGRSLATRKSAIPWVEYRIGQFSTVTGLYTFSEDTLDGRFAGTRTTSLGFERRLAARDTLSLRYERRWFHFTRDAGFQADILTRDVSSVGAAAPGAETAPAEAFVAERSTADVLTLGWLRELDEKTLLLLRAGPRSAKGAFSPELLLSLKRRLKQGRLSLTYAKTQATTLGKNGALDTQSLVVSYVGRPAKELEIAGGPGLFRNSLRGRQLVALRMNVETLWHFSAWFHLAASYVLDVQQPDFGAEGHIRRGALQVRLLVGPPQRRPEPASTDAPPQAEPD